MKIVKDSRVDRYLNTLTPDQRQRIIKVVELFQDYGFALTEKYLKKLTGDLWELRVVRQRILFGMKKDTAIITNIFYKKTQKTPLKEIKLAVNRLKQIT